MAENKYMTYREIVEKNLKANVDDEVDAIYCVVKVKDDMATISAGNTLNTLKMICCDNFKKNLNKTKVELLANLTGLALNDTKGKLLADLLGIDLEEEESSNDTGKDN